MGATAAPLASTLTYTIAPTIFAEANRVLLAAPLGTTAADGTGSIKVFVDDKPSTIGANNRTWYDGLGWALVTASNPTNLSYRVSVNTFIVSWPATHLGWILQSEANSAVGLSTNWQDIPASSFQTQALIEITATNRSMFFRLRHP